MKVCCPINAKGIVGTDGRQYLIDLGRATPVDANYLATEKEKNQESWIHPSSEPLLRPELVSVFCEALEVRLMHQKDKEVSVVLNEGGEEKVIKIDLTSSILTVETVKSSSPDLQLTLSKFAKNVINIRRKRKKQLRKRSKSRRLPPLVKKHRPNLRKRKKRLWL